MFRHMLDDQRDLRLGALDLLVVRGRAENQVNRADDPDDDDGPTLLDRPDDPIAGIFVLTSEMYALVCDIHHPSTPLTADGAAFIS